MPCWTTTPSLFKSTRPNKTGKLDSVRSVMVTNPSDPGSFAFATQADSRSSGSRSWKGFRNPSVRWWRPLAVKKSADEGDIFAQYNLRGMYENGQGVAQDYKEAAAWYRCAAEQGHDYAQYNLGVMYDLAKVWCGIIIRRQNCITVPPFKGIHMHKITLGWRIGKAKAFCRIILVPICGPTLPPIMVMLVLSN